MFNLLKKHRNYRKEYITIKYYNGLSVLSFIHKQNIPKIG